MWSANGTEPIKKIRIRKEVKIPGSIYRQVVQIRNGKLFGLGRFRYRYLFEGP